MICFTCKEDKPVEEFCKDKSSKTGISQRCRSCFSEKAKNWYQRNKKRQHDLARQPRQRFLFGKKNATQRNLTWNIEETSFYELIKQPCDYCQQPPTLETTGVWLDRLDNTKGYELDNVVPCCGRCNTSKSNNFTPEEWKVMVKAYLQYKLEAPTGIDPVSPS